MKHYPAIRILSVLIGLSPVTCSLSPLLAQLPVTVNRSYVNGGGRVLLPSFSTQNGVSAQTSDNGSETFGGSIRTTSTTFLTNVTGTVSFSPSSYPVPSGGVATFTASPIVTVVTNAPNVFTNTIVAVDSWRVDGINNGGGTFSQDYAFTIIDDVSGGGGGGGQFVPTVTLTGQADGLESISRKTTSTDPRKLIGFQLVSNTNAVLNTFAAAISNTSTNGQNFSAINFYQEANGDQTFDLSDTLLGTTTNANGFAIFSGLTIPITTTNQTFYLAGIFSPTNQTRNSFIASSLNSQNIVATIAGTNAALRVTGGNILGKQYGFFDTTDAEDAAAALALSNQINSAVNSATNNLAAADALQLANATNSLTSSFQGQINAAEAAIGAIPPPANQPAKANSLKTSIVPATAAGAAGIGAAFVSDSLSKGALSTEFTHPQK